MRRRMLGAALPLVLVAASAVALPVAAEAAAVSGLTKSVQGTGSPADHGATANWVIGYDDQATGSGAATITDAVGAGQAFQSGSLHAPPGWTPSWSTDGTTFTGTEPASGVTAVRATNPRRRARRDLAVRCPHPARAGGHDGDRRRRLQPDPVPPAGRHAAGLEHLPPPGGRFAEGGLHRPRHRAALPGRPVAEGAQHRARPARHRRAGDIASTLAPQYVRDPAAPAQVYYPAVTASSAGVGCLDLAAAANCGYWPLAAMGGSPPRQQHRRLSWRAAATCTASSPPVPWSAGPLPRKAPAAASRTRRSCRRPTSRYVYGAVTVVAGKVFASTSSPGTGQQPSLGCFDPATATACANWASSRPTGPAGNYNYNDYTAFDASGAPVGACATTTGGTDVTTCYALDGSALAAPPGPAALPGGVYAFPPEVVTDPNGHKRSYLPIWNGGYAGAALCHDWTTGTACAGLPGPITHPSVNGGATRDYGYSYDPPSGCLIGLGDAGVLFSMDPTTGATPCVRSAWPGDAEAG